MTGLERPDRKSQLRLSVLSDRTSPLYDRPLMVDYGYPFDRIRDHTAVVVLLERMTAIGRSN